jgi:hypothetical protein
MHEDGPLTWSEILPVVTRITDEWGLGFWWSDVANLASAVTRLKGKVGYDKYREKVKRELSKEK